MPTLVFHFLKNFSDFICGRSIWKSRHIICIDELKGYACEVLESIHLISKVLPLLEQKLENNFQTLLLLSLIQTDEDRQTWVGATVCPSSGVQTFFRLLWILDANENLED